MSNGENFRYIGITDECIECQKCGKADLKSTVIIGILDADGNVEEITYYGSTCAARALNVKGGGRKVLDSARNAHRKTLEAAKHAVWMLAEHGVSETGEILHERGFNGVAIQYRMNNCNAFNHHSRYTWSEWKEQAQEFINRNLADIETAKLLSR